MNFANKKDIAIVWFADSSLLALTIDCKPRDDLPENLNDNQDSISSYSLNMESFNPLDKRQHFNIHTKNIFYDSFLTIESELYPNFFLNYQNDTIKLSNQNNTRWKFIDGHFICNNGQKILIFDSIDTFSFKIINNDFLNGKNTNEANFDSRKLAEMHKESVFNLCFCNGNSIPLSVPIILYSNFHKKVITLIKSKNDYGLTLSKFDPLSSSQVWGFIPLKSYQIVSSTMPFKCLSFSGDYFRPNYDKTPKLRLEDISSKNYWSFDNFLLFEKSLMIDVNSFDNKTKNSSNSLRGKKNIMGKLHFSNAMKISKLINKLGPSSKRPRYDNDNRNRNHNNNDNDNNNNNNNNDNDKDINNNNNDKDINNNDNDNNNNNYNNNDNFNNDNDKDNNNNINNDAVINNNKIIDDEDDDYDYYDDVSVNKKVGCNDYSDDDDFEFIRGTSFNDKIIDQPNVFFIILSNQRELFNYKQDLDLAYLYNPISPIPTMLVNQPIDLYDDYSSISSFQPPEKSILGWVSYDKPDYNVDRLHYRNGTKVNKYLFTFKNDHKKKFTFTKNTINVKRKLDTFNYKKVGFWKYFNHYFVDKISISSDQRIIINNVELNDNSNITISLIKSGYSILGDFNESDFSYYCDLNDDFDANPKYNININNNDNNDNDNDGDSQFFDDDILLDSKYELIYDKPKKQLLFSDWQPSKLMHNIRMNEKIVSFISSDDSNDIYIARRSYSNSRIYSSDLEEEEESLNGGNEISKKHKKSISKKHENYFSDGENSFDSEFEINKTRKVGLINKDDHKKSLSSDNEISKKHENSFSDGENSFNSDFEINKKQKIELIDSDEHKKSFSSDNENIKKHKTSIIYSDSNDENTLNNINMLNDSQNDNSDEASSSEFSKNKIKSKKVSQKVTSSKSADNLTQKHKTDNLQSDLIKSDDQELNKFKNNNKNKKPHLISISVTDSDIDNENKTLKEEEEVSKIKPKLLNFSTDLELDNYELFDQSDIPKEIDKEFYEFLIGNQITINKDNADYCEFLGHKLGINGLIEISKFIDSFSLQYSRLSDLSEIQEKLMTINSMNYKSLTEDFTAYMNDYDYSTICWIIISVSICKPLENENLSKFCQILIRNHSIEFRNELKKSIKRTFISMDPNIFFLKKIYDNCEGLFDSDEIKMLLKTKKDNPDEIIFFCKEFHELFDIEKLDKLEEQQKNFDYFIETGFNSDEIFTVIKNDDIKLFQKVYIQLKIDKNQCLKSTQLERISILKNNPRMIQVAAFFGSIKVFKYLYLEKADLSLCDEANRNCFAFAIAGGNAEIIHIIEQALWNDDNANVITDMLQTAIKYGQNSIFQWLLSKSSDLNMKSIIKQNVILQSIISKNIYGLINFVDYIYACESIICHFSIIFDNFEFFKLLNCFYFKNKDTLICDAAICGNLDILKYLINDDGFELNESLRKIVIKIALKFDNIELFNYFADEKDFSEKNILYAFLCKSTNLIKMFINNFDFSKILVNDQPFIISLINEKEDEILNTLFNSKFFDFKEKYNNKSLFYFAVQNEMFDFALKLYNKYKGFYDVNEDYLLIENCQNPKIVEFLIDFPELNVNIRNNQFKNSIDILLNEKNKIKSILLLFKRPEIKFKFDIVIEFSIEQSNFELFEKAISISSTKKEKKSRILRDYIDDIIKFKLNEFFIFLIKSDFLNFSQNEIIQKCIEISDPEIFHEILDDKIPEEKQIEALLISIKLKSISSFKYLLSIISIDIQKLNDYLPQSDETLLTYILSQQECKQLALELLSIKSIDINKPNKNGETALNISIQRDNNKMIDKLIRHKDIKYTYNDFERLYFGKIYYAKYIIFNIKKFVDDPKKIIDFLIDSESIDVIDSIIKDKQIKIADFDDSDFIYYSDDDDDDLVTYKDADLNDDDMKYFESVKKNIFIPTILNHCVEKDKKDLFETAFIQINDSVKEEKEICDLMNDLLCKSIFNNQIYFIDKLKIYHPLLVKKSNYEKVTPFGNVRNKIVAIDLLNFLLKNKVPIEKVICEVSGLSIQNKTAFYTSIEEGNLNLFNFLLNLSDNLNHRLNNETHFDLVDKLIYTKNEDGKNPFYAACLKKNWQIFLMPLIEKMIYIKNNGYFENFSPLRAAFSNKNHHLVNFLNSKGFNIDRYCFCQIIESNSLNSKIKETVKSNKDFQFDLFMPLHLINDNEYIDQIFIEKRIDFDFSPKYLDEIDDFLLVSATRNCDEKLALKILNSIEKEKILYNWQDKNGKTALHYSIENVMPTVFYRLVDIFTSPEMNKITDTETDTDNGYWNKYGLGLFLIEDESKETPIHSLFKSFNEDFILYFYNRSMSFLKPLKKENFLNRIFNSQILSFSIEVDQSKDNNEIVPTFQQSDFVFLPDEDDDDEVFNKSDFISSFSEIKNKPKPYLFANKKEHLKKKLKNISSSDSSDSSLISLKKMLHHKETNLKLFEGETLLTFSILRKNANFVKFLLEKIPVVDPNRENSHGKIPIQLAKSDGVLFKTIIESCSQKVDSKSEKDENILNLNKNNFVFSVFWMKNYKARNFCLNLMLNYEKFDFNQKKTVLTENGSSQELFLIDFFLKRSIRISNKVLKKFFGSQKLDLNVRPNIVFKLIDSTISNEMPISPLFDRINDDIIKNARTEDGNGDTVATFAAKKYININALTALIFDKRVDFVDSKNFEGKNGVQILEEHGKFDLVKFILNNRK